MMELSIQHQVNKQEEPPLIYGTDDGGDDIIVLYPIYNCCGIVPVVSLLPLCESNLTKLSYRIALLTVLPVKML